MCAVAVTPNEAAWASARASAVSRSSGDGSGLARSIRPSRPSLKMPSGSPVRASRRISPPGGVGVSLVTPAARMAALLARASWPSSRFTNTGLSGVTESIHSRRGSGWPGQRGWSQSPPVIHWPGFRVLAYCFNRRTNSAGVAASRRSTEASWKPPPMKCVWPSAKPGMTSPPCASSVCVVPATYDAIACESPTARILPPAIATAPGWGPPLARPVQTIPFLMTRSAFGLQADAQHTSNQTAHGLRRTAHLLAELADVADRLERGERVRAGLARRRVRRLQRIADVEQDLEQQLLALVGGVEVGHAPLVGRGLGAVVGFAVDRLEVREDTFARTRRHGLEDTGRSTTPLGTFGTKYVDLGGITSPPAATPPT